MCNTTASSLSWTLCLDSHVQYSGKLTVLDTLFGFSRAKPIQAPYGKLSVLDTLFGFSYAILRQAPSLGHSVWILTCNTNPSSLRQALSLGHFVWIIVCNTTARSQSWTLFLDSHVQYYGKLPVLNTLFGFSRAILRQALSLGHSVWILGCNTTASTQSWTLCLDSRMQYYGKLPVLDTLFGFSDAILRQAPSLGHSVWILGCNTTASSQFWTLCLDSHVQYYGKLQVLDTQFEFSHAILRQAPSLGHSVWILGCNTTASSQSWTLCLDSRMQYSGKLQVLDTQFEFSHAILRQAPSLGHSVWILGCNTTASSQFWTLCLDSHVQYYGKLQVLDTQFEFSHAILRHSPSLGHSVWILACNATTSYQSWTLCLDSHVQNSGKLPVLDTLLGFSRAILRQAPSLGHSAWILTCNTTASSQSWTLCLDSRMQYSGKLPVLDTLLGFSRAILQQAPSLGHSVWILGCNTPASYQSWTLCFDSRVQYLGKLTVLDTLFEFSVLDTLFGFSRAILRQAHSLGRSVWILGCNTPASSQSWTLCLNSLSWTLCLDSHVQYSGKLTVLDTLFEFSVLDTLFEFSVLDTLFRFSRAIVRQAQSLGHSVWILTCNTPARSQSWTLCLDSHVQYYGKLPVLDTPFGFSRAILR